jgi:hypothetical protein
MSRYDEISFWLDQNLYRYEDRGQLLATIEEKVIAPAEGKVEEIRRAGR